VTAVAEVQRGILRLPAAPLLEAIAAQCASRGVSHSRVLGPTGMTCHGRVRAKGIVAASVARRLCDLAGLNPREVYGDAWREPTVRHSYGERRPAVYRPNLHLDAAPLVELIESRLRRYTERLEVLPGPVPPYAEAVGMVFGEHQALLRAFQRTRERGWVILPTAEKFCDYFGWHPYQLWGDAYDAAALAGTAEDFNPWEGVA
jgi:hypothetical protein